MTVDKKAYFEFDSEGNKSVIINIQMNLDGIDQLPKDRPLDKKIMIFCQG